MTESEPRVVAVVGAGDMGHGIAELLALRGFEARVRDVNEDALASAAVRVRRSLDKLVEKQVVSKEGAEAAFNRLTFSSDPDTAFKNVDFVIEAVPENLELKQRVFAEAEKAAPGAVLATNTSTMKITEIAEGVTARDRVVGMHFFNPVMLMDLVEIIPGAETSEETISATRRVSEAMGKQVVVLAKDSPGFVTSRLIGTWVGAAILLHERGLATREEIDSALKFGAGFPMGAFELADYTGLDVGYHAANYIASKLGTAYAPLPSLTKLMEEGHLGKKTGRGFYEWSNGRNSAALTPDKAKAFDPAKVMAVVANEAAKLLDQGVASAKDVDKAMRLGCAFPKGPLEWADAYGLDRVLEILVDLKEQHGHAMFEPYELLVELVEEGSLGRSTGKGFRDYAAADARGGAATSGSTGARETPGAGSSFTADGAPAANLPQASTEAQTARAETSAPALDIHGGYHFENVLVDVDVDTHVATITLNRPHRLNAITGDLVRDLDDAFARLERDENARVVVLRGSGEKAFCAGADLTETGDITPAIALEIARNLNSALLRFERSGKIVIAAMNGHAFGGGFEIALACDFRLAAKRAKMGLTEVTLGLIPASGGTMRVAKLVGLARAKEVVLLGDKFSADDAKDMGLVHRVFENESFDQEVEAFARRLSRGAPIAQRLSKRSLNNAATMTNEQGAEFEAASFGILLSTEDAMEGVAALFSRREPQFKGR